MGQVEGFCNQSELQSELAKLGASSIVAHRPGQNFGTLVSMFFGLLQLSLLGLMIAKLVDSGNKNGLDLAGAAVTDETQLKLHVLHAMMAFAHCDMLMILVLPGSSRCIVVAAVATLSGLIRRACWQKILWCAVVQLWIWGPNDSWG